MITNLESVNMDHMFPSIPRQMAYKNDISWDKCIKRESVFEAGILVKRNILPSQRELNNAVRVFGRHSTQLKDICNLICRYIKRTSQDVIDIYPSYRSDIVLSTTYVDVVFVVTIKTNSESSLLKDYDYYIKFENQFSEEGELVTFEETPNQMFNTQCDNNILERIRACINKNADSLLEKHSNLNVILPSLKKSVGYTSDRHEIKDDPCIALYVTVKGYIPLNEEPFKREIDGFQIDVLEGEFEPFTGGPNEYHDHLKIGLAIHANISEGGCILGGTLGGFVEHSLYGLCGITCAHIFYDNVELTAIKEHKSFGNKKVYQPIGERSTSFSEVVLAVYDEGNHSLPGMEVALINIQCRQPKDGSFPEAFNDTEAGFDDSNRLCFNSGEVCDKAYIKRRTEVYKFGMSTGITRGSFELQGAVLRKREMQGQRHGHKFNLKDQMVILQIGDNKFAEPGDSGALVLMEGDQDSVAIGIVEGGMRNLVFVTPICDILRAFGCVELKISRQ